MSGLGLEAQEDAVAAAAEARRWSVVATDVDAGAVVAKLDRLSKSLLDVAQLMDRRGREGWGLIALDLALDTATPQGEMMANVATADAQLEQRLIGQPTRHARAVKKAQGQHLGRRVELPESTRQWVVELRAQGMAMEAVGSSLATEGVPTARGGRWAPEDGGRGVAIGGPGCRRRCGRTCLPNLARQMNGTR